MKKNIENNEYWKTDDDKIFGPLDEMEIPEPSGSLKDSFSRKLSQISSNETFLSDKLHIHVYIKVAVIAAVFVFGWFLGSINNRNDRILLQNVQSQLDNNNKLLVLTLLQQSSASDRLQATNVSFSLPSIDNQVISALVKALESDPDPNVKIKCAEVLATHLNPDSINTIFGHALEYQCEPLVQLVLIDYLSNLGNAKSKIIVKNFLRSDKADEFVRSELKQSINL